MGPFAWRSDRVAIGDTIRPAAVVVDGATVTAVLDRDAPIPGGVEVTDLGADLVVPGLIDCHTHLLLDGETRGFAYERQLLTSESLRALRAAAAAREMLGFGFTTARDVCTEGAGYADVALALAIRDGTVPGARVVPSGRGIAITGGYMPGAAPGGCLPTGCAIVDGPDDARREVRTQVASGVAWIKVFADWPCRSAPGHPPAVCPTFTEAELGAICDEARRRGGRRVAAHVTSDAGARQAIGCGAASLEHLAPMSRETLDLAAERGVFVVPTLSIGHYLPPDASASDAARRDRQVDELHATMERALAAGVRIACGTDLGCFPHALGSLQELQHLIAHGMTAERALAAATSEAAALLGMPELGRIGEGAAADLVVFQATAPFDLGATLRSRPVRVVRAGR